MREKLLLNIFYILFEDGWITEKERDTMKSLIGRY